MPPPSWPVLARVSDIAVKSFHFIGEACWRLSSLGDRQLCVELTEEMKDQLSGVPAFALTL